MKNRGFTIVELLVVIVVIGILAAITIVSYTGISQKATVSSLQSDLSNASIQLKVFQVINSNFPVTNNCSNPESSTNICLKVSGGNTFTYTPASGSSPQAFSLVAKNNNTYYHLTNNTQPTAVTPINEASVSATGTYTLSSDGPYRIYKFTGNGSITTTTPGTAEVLVVAGGGGGATGGGGAGGYLTGQQILTGTMAVTVGAGGPGIYTITPTAGLPGTDGGDSIFGTRTAKGGGAGGGSGGVGRAGGSSGGAGCDNYSPATAATPSGQGYAGGRPDGGGGGAGGNGGNGVDNVTGGIGGPGLSNDISGSSVGYAGGGGGSTWVGESGAGAASHGGGAGGNLFQNGGAGSANTGGGGGGAGYAATGGSGGSGIVIIRYLTP